MILTKEQRRGAIIILIIALTGWLIAAFWPQSQPVGEPPAPPAEKPSQKKSWEAYHDSIDRADQDRYARWAAQRQIRYDSAKQASRHFWDSCRVADSLWRDSVGWKTTAKHIKKDTVLDLNHCDTTELLYIRGIGRYTAIQIVHYRDQLGGYYSAAQLTDEPFAKCRLDTLLDHFTADPADVQRINVNTCSIDRLQRHPYLRYNQAKAIYTLRRQRLHLSSIGDLASLPELSPDDLLRLAPYLAFE